MRAIRAAHAFDGTGFLPGGATVLVDRETIVGIEPFQADLPAGTEVTEYDGTVLPGLFDCHSHLVADGSLGALERVGVMADEEIDSVIEASLQAQVRAGVTTVRDLGDRHFRTLGFRERPGLPRVVAAGPPLTTPGGHCHYLGGVVQDDLGTAVAGHVDRDVDVIKVMASGGFATPGTDPLAAQFSVAELRTVVEHAHGAGLPVVAHAHSLAGMENALAAGVDGIEHFTGLAPGGPRIGDDLLQEAARLGVRVDLTTGIDPVAQAALPELPPALRALLAGMGFPTVAALHEAAIDLFRRLREHGVVVITGVDSGIAPPKQHGNAWRTVGELVEAGYPVAEALAAATSVAAEACGLAATTGRLAKGYAADVLVVDGNVDQDPGVLGAPLEVLTRGISVASALPSHASAQPGRREGS